MVISINHKRVQTWELPFDLKGLKINDEHTFKTEEDDAGIILKPSDKNGAHGEIVFRLPELPHSEDGATDISKASIESIFRFDFVISASIDTGFMKIECDEKALCTDEKLISKFGIEKVKQIPKQPCKTVRVHAVSDDSDLKRFISFLKKLKTHPEKKTLDRCKEWFKRGIEEENTEEKDTANMFIMYWIAFNGLYSLFKPKCDTTAVKMLLNDYPKDVDVILNIINKHNKIIDSLCQKNLTNQNGTKNYSDDLKQSLESTTNNHRKMQCIGLCLWQVRNDIFHGGNTPKEERDFIKDCAYLLKDMFRSAMYSYVVGK